tara:strand:+ start:1307 stop:1579 length:273 start_codon:yes stop_codon:yes gene_type:complete
MSEEHERLDKLSKVMPDNVYSDYLQGRALAALQRYRETNDITDLEEMQFYMHRITHQVLKSLEESTKVREALAEQKKLNIMSSIYEGYDG